MKDHSHDKGKDADEVTVETDDSLDDSVIAEEHQGDTIKKLREKLKVAQAEAKQYLDGWQREKADFINIRRRDDETKSEFLKFAKEEIVSDILPVLDSFELATANKASWEGAPAEWRKGMESIFNQLQNTLERHGVKKIYPLGHAFDPKLHEAVSTALVNEKGEDHTVVQVLQTGYELGGKVIRPARVIVGEFSDTQA